MYLTNDKFKEKYPDHDHYCWICKCYMSDPYEVKVIVGDLVVTVPLCFDHKRMILKEQVDIIDKK